MAKVKVIYEKYENGKQFHTFLDNVANINIETTQQIYSNYEELNYSIFDQYSFPPEAYFHDLISALNNSLAIVNNAEQLANYAATNFSDAEEAIEKDIKKYLTFKENLYNSVNYEGYHYSSESLVYWEPGIDGYTAQGYTETDKYKVISAYREGGNSRLYYYDKETGEFVGYVILNNKAHVGGIAYDPDDNIIFVTGEDGKVNCYDHSAIERAFDATANQKSTSLIVDLNAEENYGIEIKCDIDIRDELKTIDAATVYYHDGKLYVATYRTKGDLVSYDINCSRKPNGDVNLDVGKMHVVSHDCPSAIQGISIFEKDGKQYVAFARSAKLSPSSIDVYELNEDGTLGEMSGSLTINHRGLEGIEVHDDGSITGIYEYEGSTTLDDNIDNIIGNGQKNPYDADYYGQAYVWNMFIKKVGNASYEEAMDAIDKQEGYHYPGTS